MQALLTKYHGPTNTRGARLTAKAAAGSTSVPYDHGADFETNHRIASKALLVKLGWTPGNGYTPFVGGCLPSGDYAWVATSKVQA